MPTARAASLRPQPATRSSRSGIAIAVGRALEPLKSWSLSRFCGSPAEKIIWLQFHADAPEAIIQALHDAGFAIAPMGGPMPTSVHATADEYPFRTSYRAQLEVKPMVIGFAQDFPSDLVADPDFRRNHLPRLIARRMLREFEDVVAEQLAQAIEARQGPDPQGLDAKHESAVGNADAPQSYHGGKDGSR